MAGKSSLALWLGLVVSAGTPLAGQGPPARHGFWWGFGIGYGDWRFTCDRCASRSGDEPVIGGYLTVGGVLDEHLVLALELSGAGVSGRQGRASATSLTASVYPWRVRGFFLRVGAGRSGYRQASYAEYPDFRSGGGPGYLAAIGWDAAIDRKIAFTAMLTYRFARPGTVAVFIDTLATNFRQRSVSLSFGLTFP